MNQSDKASTRRRRSSHLQNLDDAVQDNEIIASSLERSSGRSRRRRITSTDSSPVTEENNQAQKEDKKDDISFSKWPRRSTRNCSNSSSNSNSRPQSLNDTKKKRKMTTSTMESAIASKKKHTMTSRSTTTALSISTTTTDRRTTRSSSKSATKKRITSVTPSPITSSTTETAFGFTSPIQTTTKQTFRRKININDVKRSLPSGVVDLYHDDSTTISVESNEHIKNQPKLNRSLSLTSRCKYRERSTISSDSFTESLTVEFIRTYGKEYWNALHKSEKPIIYDPSMSDNARNLSSPNKRRNNNKYGIPFGSPHSSSSSSSTSLSLSSTMSKVTPNEKHNDFVLNEDWNKDNNSYQPCESTALMSVQPQLTPKMRSILIDWLIELSEHFSFETSTLHLAVTMVDRVLASGKSLQAGNEERRRLSSVSSHPLSSWTKDSHNSCYDTDSNTDKEDGNNDDDNDDDDDDDDEEGSKDTLCYRIPRDRFQLLGATCVWLSCKVQEISPPKAKEIAYVSDHIYTIEQIKTMERRVCNALNFTFFEAPTPHQFLFEFIRASFAQEAASSCTNITPGTCSCSSCGCIVTAAVTGVGSAIDSVFRDMAHYLLELGRLPFGPTGRKPSLLAAAVVYLTRVTLGIPRTAGYRLSSLSGPDYDVYWTPTLVHYTGYSKCDIFETVLEIHAYHMAAETSNLKAVFNKYKSKKFHRVALKTVVLREDLGF